MPFGIAFAEHIHGGKIAIIRMCRIVLPYVIPFILGTIIVAVGFACGMEEAFKREGIILFRTVTVIIPHAEFKARAGTVMLGGFLKPLKRLRFIFFYAGAGPIT